MLRRADFGSSCLFATVGCEFTLDLDEIIAGLTADLPCMPHEDFWREYYDEELRREVAEWHPRPLELLRTQKRPAAKQLVKIIQAAGKRRPIDVLFERPPYESWVSWLAHDASHLLCAESFDAGNAEAGLRHLCLGHKRRHQCHLARAP